MQFKNLAFSAFAATALAQGASQSEDLVSVLSVLQTALPSSLVAEALTNSGAVSSQIASQFAAGATPSWYSALPSNVQTYLVPASATGILGGSGSNSTMNGTAAGGNSSSSSNSTMTTTRSRATITPTSSSGSGGNGGSGSGSGSGSSGSQSSGAGFQGSSSSQSGNAAAPTAIFGAGLAGAVGIVGLLAL